MPRTSGTYAPPSNSVSPAVANTTIESADWNELFDDVGLAITGTLAKNGVPSLSAPLKLANGSDSAPSLTFASDTNTGAYRKSADTIGMGTNGAEAAAFGTAGLALPAAGGATGLQATSWTPTVTFATPGDFSPTYAEQMGRYTRVGNIVFYALRLQFTTNAYTTASGIFRINGLPVTSAAFDQSMAIAGTEVTDISASVVCLSAYIPASTTRIQLQQSRDALASVNVTIAQIPASTANFVFSLNGWYFV